MAILLSQTARAEEMKATWISYLDWEELPSDQIAFEQAVDNMMEHYRQLGLNTVFVHAHGLKIHAWFNPYRVTGYLMAWEEVSNKSSAKQWWIELCLQ